MGSMDHYLPGWLNTDKYFHAIRDRDLVFMDVTEPFPLPDCSVDYIFSEHVVEHITYDQCDKLIRECFRVLKPDGRIRISTPDLQSLFALYTDRKTETLKKYIETAIQSSGYKCPSERECFAFNNLFYNHGHRFIFDEPTLTDLLQAAGFSQITRHMPGQSDDPNLRGIDKRAQPTFEWYDVSMLETMSLEALRAE
ncbi:MAG: methyltransferase domain-containing protein [Cyanobacteria bacterium]|nr:methyltransferase domain-containing protein [Cyanobacteriota bacterium]